MEENSPEIVVISDVHLGTYGCHAQELLKYIKSIRPHTLILNGDIIDIWNFSKSYFPSSHMNVIRAILKMAVKGTKVIYITGNHDDLLRQYSDLEIGNFQIVDKFVLELDGQKAWIFHGDVFDNMTQGFARILAKLGGKGYDILIVLNRLLNWFLKKIGKNKKSFSKAIKDSVKKAVSWVSNFELIAAQLAIEKKYDYVVCGHIHKQQIRTITTEKGSVIYLNSGDWVENLTALEYKNGSWSIYQYDENNFPIDSSEIEKIDVYNLINKIIAS